MSHESKFIYHPAVLQLLFVGFTLRNRKHEHELPPTFFSLKFSARREIPLCFDSHFPEGLVRRVQSGHANSMTMMGWDVLTEDIIVVPTSWTARGITDVFFNENKQILESILVSKADISITQGDDEKSQASKVVVGGVG